ncbi:MAG: hypothetical protein QOK38_3943 [Acidobacteriaceae bacterium]|nr:hypothetical protein [Acidobacteriaceae bacterium]
MKRLRGGSGIGALVCFHFRCIQARRRSRGFFVKKSHTVRNLAARSNSENVLVWLRGAVFVLAACVAAQAGMAQSVRLVPSTARFAGDGSGNATNDGPGSATTIPLTAPTYVASGVSGNIYIADTGNNCIRRVDTSGNMTVAVGEGGGNTCTSASSVTTYTTGVSNPSGVAFNATGDLFVADTGHNCVRRLSAGATGIANLQPLVGTCTDPSSVSVAPAPSGVAVDTAGPLYISLKD